LKKKRFEFDIAGILNAPLTNVQKREVLNHILYGVSGTLYVLDNKSNIETPFSFEILPQ
jgi:hypothetical protein